MVVLLIKQCKFKLASPAVSIQDSLLNGRICIWLGLEKCIFNGNCT